MINHLFWALAIPLLSQQFNSVGFKNFKSLKKKSLCYIHYIVAWQPRGPEQRGRDRVWRICLKYFNFHFNTPAAGMTKIYAREKEVHTRGDNITRLENAEIKPIECDNGKHSRQSESRGRRGIRRSLDGARQQWLVSPSRQHNWLPVATLY